MLIFTHHIDTELDKYSVFHHISLLIVSLLNRI